MHPRREADTSLTAWPRNPLGHPGAARQERHTPARVSIQRPLGSHTSLAREDSLGSPLAQKHRQAPCKRPGSGLNSRKASGVGRSSSLTRSLLGEEHRNRPGPGRHCLLTRCSLVTHRAIVLS